MIIQKSSFDEESDMSDDFENEDNLNEDFSEDDFDDNPSIDSLLDELVNLVEEEG